MQNPQLASSKDCTGCMACVDVCHHDALEPYLDDDGHVYVKFDTEKCVECHICETVCPITNQIKYSSNKIKNSTPFSVYAKDKKLYDNSTSGGLFAALAKEFIDNGGYVCGVIMIDNQAVHVITNAKADIHKMQGSKYMQSNTKGIYKQINKLLKAGKKVLFSGMGCQCAAICSFFQKSNYIDNLYIIDIICGGVPSASLSRMFIDNNKQYKEIFGFRKKNEYVLSCVKKDNTIDYLYGKKVLPQFGFFSGLTNRYSCGNCQFCGVERMSDMTIGDYWGDKSEIHKSIAIVHSSKGMKLLNESKSLHIDKTNWDFLKYNYRIVIGKTYNNNRWQRNLLPWIFKHLSYQSICQFYGCYFKNPLWLLLYIITKIESKLLCVIIKSRSNRIIKHI